MRGIEPHGEIAAGCRSPAECAEFAPGRGDFAGTAFKATAIDGFVGDDRFSGNPRRYFRLLYRRLVNGPVHGQIIGRELPFGGGPVAKVRRSVPHGGGRAKLQDA
jgi:hypothetical protein